MALESRANALEFIEEITKNADAVQSDVLAEILTQNAQTEYLRSFNLGGATDRKTFKSKVPMSNYDDIEPFIRRIANGDRSPILSAYPTSELIQRNVEGHGLDKGKSFYPFVLKPDIPSPSGIPVRAGTASLMKIINSKTGPDSPFDGQTSPNEAIMCSDTQMLCGLYHCREVVRIRFSFASGVLQVINFLRENWQQLTWDIRTGSLNPEVTDESIRERMPRVLLPDPDLADFIADECGKDSWEGIIARIWPNTKYLDTIVTGSMAQYIPTLDYYYSGGLPKVSMAYVSSECPMGINLNPLCNPSEISYTIMPNMAYFEFLPHHPNSPKLIESSQLGGRGNWPGIRNSGYHIQWLIMSISSR